MICTMTHRLSIIKYNYNFMSEALCDFSLDIHSSRDEITQDVSQMMNCTYTHELPGGLVKFRNLLLGILRLLSVCNGCQRGIRSGKCFIKHFFSSFSPFLFFNSRFAMVNAAPINSINRTGE